jgi:hypothetical protein
MINGVTDQSDLADSDLDVISYADWGAAFFKHAVTSERILGAVSGLAGRPIDFGPIGVGPAKIAKVSARGQVGEATAHRVGTDPVRHRIVLPVDLNLEIVLPLETHRFEAELEVPINLTAKAVSPLGIFIDIEPPHSRSIEVKLQAGGLRSSVLQRIADVEGEICKFVAKYVAREVDKPHIRQARTIDVGAIIDRSYKA